jgi:hypothetical protein
VLPPAATALQPAVLWAGWSTAADRHRLRTALADPLLLLLLLLCAGYGSRLCAHISATPSADASMCKHTVPCALLLVRSTRWPLLCWPLPAFARGFKGRLLEAVQPGLAVRLLLLLLPV